MSKITLLLDELRAVKTEQEQLAIAGNPRWLELDARISELQREIQEEEDMEYDKSRHRAW